MAIIIGVVAGGLVVIAIIGILAAIAIPNLLTATQRSRQKRTMADIRTVATAVEAYAGEHRTYPRGSSVADLQSQLSPKYMATVPTKDGWTRDLSYAANDEGYTIGSSGADGMFDPGVFEDRSKRATRNFDCDIIYANGEFLQYPQGAQSGGGN